MSMYICARAQTSHILDSTPLLKSRNVVVLTISGKINPSIIIPFTIGNYKSLFMLDTGYAGAPVLNTKILDIHFEGNIDAYLTKISQVTCSNECANRKMDRFKTSNKCIDYTSGCVLRLMGIGATSEKASDMLLCPHIAMKCASSNEYLNVKKNVNITQADVLMTNHELTSPHILTLDYLRHLAPCMLYLKDGYMSLAMGTTEFLYERAQCSHVSSETVGGAYVCMVHIAGVDVRCTVDTGASTTICVGQSTMRRMKGVNTTGAHIEQVGINSEVVCSDIVRCNVHFCNKSFADVPIFVNQQNIEETDGYVGLGFLKAFNLLITPLSLFAQYNGAPIASLDSYSDVSREGTCA
tara:strand:+ start:4046 stop:5104 length:1059 start_codon:yes stop_codon:yes gene_type:complete